MYIRERSARTARVSELSAAALFIYSNTPRMLYTHCDAYRVHIVTTSRDLLIYGFVPHAMHVKFGVYLTVSGSGPPKRSIRRLRKYACLHQSCTAFSWCGISTRFQRAPLARTFRIRSREKIAQFTGAARIVRIHTYIPYVFSRVSYFQIDPKNQQKTFRWRRANAIRTKRLNKHRALCLGFYATNS